MLRILIQFIITTVMFSQAETMSKTGQIESYDQSGNIVIDNSIKNDGYYQRGITQSFTRSNDVVTDHLTGLQWQDDIAVQTIQLPIITQANYDAGNYTETSGNTAATYCSNLVLNGLTNWRLPTIKELRTIMNYDGNSPVAFGNEIFINDGSNYWSSTTSVEYATESWVVKKNIGFISTNTKNRNNTPRCVH